MNLRPYTEADEAAVIDLWRACGLVRPWNDPRRDIERKLGVQRELFLVGDIGGRLVASVMAGYDGHRGWVNYLAVHPDFRRRQFGRSMMDTVQQRLLQMGCPKLNLQVRTTNREAADFYDSIGFSRDESVCFGKRLIADDPPG